MPPSDTPHQLSLGVSLYDEATFDNFYVPDDSPNAQAVEALQQQLQAEGEQSVYLWGPPGCGLTHLLQAACHRAHNAGVYAQYLPLHDLAGYEPASLTEGLVAQDLVCLDNLEAVVGNPQWDEALFILFNQMRDAGKRLVFSAYCSPNQLQCYLEDLRSRLNWGVVYHLDLLGDGEKKQALQQRARGRGMTMSDEVAQFILNRAPRDMNHLFDLLNTLDEVSLQEQRRLTIPFVSEVLGRV